MPPIAARKLELDGYFNLVHRSVVVLIRLKNGNAVNFGTGFVVSSGRHRVLVCVEKKLIKEDESIAVRFYDGTRVGARVFMKKTTLRHAVLEVISRLRPPPVTFSDFEVTRQDIFAVAAVHMKGALGLMTGTVGNPNCRAVTTSGRVVYRSEGTFAMSCPAAGPSKMPVHQVIMDEPEEILKLIGAPVFDTSGLVIGTIDTADPFSPTLKFAIKTMFFLDKLETYLKKIDNEISLLRGRRGLSQGPGTSKLCDTTSGSSNRKRGRGNAPPSGTGTSKTVCINQVKGNVELVSESNMVAIRREAVERALMRLVTKESDDVRRSSTNSVARNPGEGDSDKIIAIEPFDLNDFFGGDVKINGYKSLKNGTTDQVEKIVKFLKEGQIASADVVDAVISPPYVFLPIVMDKLRPKIQVAAQNCWVKKGGAFTGEASAEMLANLGIPWVILGHSERRSLLEESSEFVGDKAASALAKGLKVITCVGETLEQREAGSTTAVVAEQTRAIADKITDWSDVVIAYEPVWAIGTGKVATPAQAQEVHANLRDWLKTNVSLEVAESTRIIYGGPVTGASSKEFAAQPDVEGFLVCGASLKPEFTDIISTAIMKYA